MVQENSATDALVELGRQMLEQIRATGEQDAAEINATVEALLHYARLLRAAPDESRADLD